MTHMARATVTVVIAVVTVALVGASCRGAQLEAMAGSPTDRVATANLCAVKAAQLSMTNPCAVEVKQAFADHPCAARVIAAAAKQPCTANPCATKNPCAANPCAADATIDSTLVTRPTGTTLVMTNRADLVTQGERLWRDPVLSTKGLTCQTCHINHGSFLTTFSQPYPHMVAMAKDRASLDKINIDEMVQLCMVVPMAAKPLPWDSKELAALSAHSL
jgi:hypothetical protein